MDFSDRGPAASTVGPRERALALLRTFRVSVLPSFVRRSRSWTGLDPSAHADVIDDVSQELALDCVENAETIVALSPQARHKRWLRLAQQQHYAVRVRTQRHGRDVERLDRGAPPPTAIDLPLDPQDIELLDRIARHAERLGNGRFCARATARSMRVGHETLRRIWAEFADALGLDHEHVEFWRRRLAEALCMIAAARLRERGVVRLWDDDARRAYDPEAFRRRLLRIRDALGVRPIDTELRRALEHVAPRRAARQLEPRALLDIAERIAAGDPLVLMWRFEAELCDGGDVYEAARCLWEARRLEKDRGRIVLARARLLEARGELRAARRVLERAIARRRRFDPRLVASLRAAGGAVARSAPSARSIDRRPGDRGSAASNAS